MRQVVLHRGEVVTTRLYDPKEHARPLLRLYQRYADELAKVGPSGFNPDAPWWEKPEQCRTVLAALPGGLAGFLMVGYSEQVDDDVASEICEAYVVPQWRGSGVLRRMFDAAAPLLREPWGFQVLASNSRMWRCAECWLRRRSIDFAVRGTVEDEAVVRKYRILTTE